MKKTNIIYLVLIFFIIISFFNYKGILSFKTTHKIKQSSKSQKDSVFIQKGPNFSLHELILLQTQNASHFENYSLDKGYTYDSSEKSDTSVTIKYTYTKEEAINGNRYNVSYSFPKLGLNGPKSVHWYFLNTNKEKLLDTLYLSKKKEAEKFGYKNWNVSSHQELTSFSYVKENTLIDFNIGTASGTQIPVYGIYIRDVPK
jgi:hypothetical protein